MKKLFTLGTFCFLLCTFTYAADIIVLTNNTRIEAKILEVSDTEIKYKKASNTDGPTFIQKTDQISVVIYDDGEVVSYAGNPKKASQAKETTTEQPASDNKNNAATNSTENTTASSTQPKEKALKFNPQPSDKYWFGLTFGYVSKTVKENGLSGSLLMGVQNKVSPAMRFGVTMNPTFKYGIGLQSGVFMEYAREVQSEGGGEYKQTAHDITFSLPLQLSYRYELIKNLSFMIYTGPVFDFGAYLALSTYDENPATPANKTSDNLYSESSKYIGFNALWGIGAGVQWSHLRLNVGGEFGMVAKNEVGKWNKPVYITLTWLF